MNESITIKIDLQGAQKTANSIKELNLNLNRTTEEVDSTDKSVKSLKSSLSGILSSFAILSISADKLSRNFEVFGQSGKFSSGFVRTLSESLVPLNKGIFGATVSLGTVSAALASFGIILQKTENPIFNTIGKISILAAVITGSLSLATGFAIKKTGELISFIGDKLTNAAQSAAARFIELQQRTFVYERTITNFNKVFGNTIGNLETYNSLILDLAKNNGLAVESLQTATVELVAAGSQFGLNRKQLEFLLKASVDYAQVAKVDVVQATLDLIAGINGSSQSVLKYGIKLTEATVAQKLLAKGIDFNALTEYEKIQQRLNVLISQYAPIAGLAAESSKTLAGQQKVLEANIKNINAAFGAGTAIIEESGIKSFSLNLILSNLNTTLVKGIGFFTALVGRLLSVGGFALESSLKILLVVKAVNLLDAALKTSIVQTAFSKSIPLINKNVIELIGSLGVLKVDLTSTTGVLKTFSSAILASFKQILSVVSGVSVSSLTLSTFIRGALATSFTILASAIRIASTAMFAFLANPLVIKIGLIVGSLYLLYKTFQEIESRTNIFSNSLNALLSVFRIFNPIIDATKSVFSNFFDFISAKISDFANRTLGLMVYSITKTIEAITTLASKFPLISSAVGGEIPDSVKNSITKIKELNKELENSGFRLTEIKKNVESLNEEFKKPFDFKALEKLREELKKTDELTLEGLKKQKIERIALVTSGYQQELIKKKDFEQLKLSIEKDFLTKSDELFKKQQEQRRRLIQLGAERPIESLFSKNKDIRAGALGSIGKSITQGAAGAASLLGSTVQSLGNKIAPGVGEFAGPIVQELAKGKEAAKTFVTEFLNSIPDMVVGFTEGIISAMDTMAEKAPEVIDRLVKNAPRIISAIIEGLPRVFLEMQNLMPSVAVSFATSLISEAPRIAEAIAKSIGNAPGNAVKGIGRVFKFAEGGQGFVKSVPPGFGNGSTERFPAILGSGELVVDRSTATKLKDFLSTQSGSMTDSFNDSGSKNMNLIEALINRPIIVNIDGREVARATRNQVRSGFVLA